MYQIPGNTCYPPGEGGGNAAEKKAFAYGTEKAEKQTENTRYKCPGKRRVAPAENARRENEQRPGIKIHNPPVAEAENRTLDENKYGDYEADLFAEMLGKHQQPEGGKLNIRKLHHCHLAYLDDSHHYSHKCHIKNG